MTRPVIVTVLVLAGIGAAATPAAAQSGGLSGAIEVAVGPLYMNRSPLAAGDAKETTPSGDAFTLFTTDTTLSAMTAAELQVGVHLTDRLEIFGATSFGTRQLRIEASNDKENAPAVTASERVQQYIFTGGALWFLTQSRVAPFVSVEAGQLRELHQGKTLVESGLVYMAGGGVNLLFADRGAAGLRIAGRALLRSQDFLLNTKRVSPAMGVSVFVRF